MNNYECIHHRVFGILSPHWFVIYKGGYNSPIIPAIVAPHNKEHALLYGYSTLQYPRKLRKFKKLRCRYLTAENWKPCPIVRGSRGNIAGVYNMVASMYDITPHKTKLAP